MVAKTNRNTKVKVVVNGFVVNRGSSLETRDDDDDDDETEDRIR